MIPAEESFFSPDDQSDFPLRLEGFGNVPPFYQACKLWKDAVSSREDPFLRNARFSLNAAHVVSLAVASTTGIGNA